MLNVPHRLRLSARALGRLTLPRLTLREPLVFPASGLFTRFIVTYVSIRTSDTSSNLTGHLRRLTERSLTNVSLNRRAPTLYADVASLRQSSSAESLLRYCLPQLWCAF